MAFRSVSAVVGGNSGTPITPASPPGVREYDHVLLFVAIDTGAGSVITIPPEFKLIAIATQVTPDGQTGLIAWKIASAAEPATYSVNSSGGDPTAFSMAFSGRSSRNQPTWSVLLNTSGNASPVSVGATGITALAGDDLVWAAFMDQSAASIGTSFAPPAGYTERVDSVNQGTTAFNSQSAATLDNASAGATGTVTGTFTMSSGTAGFGVFLLRLPANELQGPDTELTTTSKRRANIQQRMAA
jgi:hypothetical protein